MVLDWQDPRKKCPSAWCVVSPGVPACTAMPSHVTGMAGSPENDHKLVVCSPSTYFSRPDWWRCQLIWDHWLSFMPEKGTQQMLNPRGEMDTVDAPWPV